MIHFFICNFISWKELIAEATISCFCVSLIDVGLTDKIAEVDENQNKLENKKEKEIRKRNYANEFFK